MRGVAASAEARRQGQLPKASSAGAHKHTHSHQVELLAPRSHPACRTHLPTSRASNPRATQLASVPGTTTRFPGATRLCTEAIPRHRSLAQPLTSPISPVQQPFVQAPPATGDSRPQLNPRIKTLVHPTTAPVQSHQTLLQATLTHPYKPPRRKPNRNIPQHHPRPTLHSSYAWVTISGRYLPNRPVNQQRNAETRFEIDRKKAEGESQQKRA